MMLRFLCMVAMAACAVDAAAFTQTPSTRSALHALLDAAKASHSDTLLVRRDGRTLLDYSRSGRTTGAIEMMSATKSVVALAIGRMLAQGKLTSLDQPVSGFYPEWKQGSKAKITVRMLLNHTSGVQNVPNTGVEIYPAPDAIQIALAAELTDPPGTRFSYNNKAMNLLAGIVEKATGVPMDVYLQREVFAPMGIRAEPWDDRDKVGHPYAMSGWKATADDAARIGELVLANGRWNGVQLIPASYIREMLAQSQPFSTRYGLLWWRVPAWQRFQVDDRSFARLRARGVSAGFIDKLAPLRGHRFDNREGMLKAIAKALGADWRQQWALEMEGHKLTAETVFNGDIGPVVAYEAEGYLGQYIVVVPAADLVAVRQIERPATFTGEQPWPWGWDEFPQQVLALARTWAPNLAANEPPRLETPRENESHKVTSDRFQRPRPDSLSRRKGVG